MSTAANLKIRQAFANRLVSIMQATPEVGSQVRLAKAANLSQASIQRFLSLASSATIDNVAKLAEALGISPGELLEDPASRIQYDRSAYALLSAEEKRGIELFVAFTIHQHFHGGMGGSNGVV
ncbi:helix-turn-helix domain-containing protein [Gulbenkiania mobilis]|uniref:helix-turn-helix domain-containing protein n=1 Tax=Gulbenkiania mobilis TaxID=397457 RepID=UPI00137927E1|nr:helix-turn-helix transcriptional regulator [Gulbenkiania mobilis]